MRKWAICAILILTITTTTKAHSDGGAETETVIVGRITYYRPGLMRTVAANRHMNLEGYMDGLALIPCDLVGRTVYLQPPGMARQGPFLCVDCAAAEHHALRDSLGDVAEISYELAAAWSGKVPGWTLRHGPLRGVTVYIVGSAPSAVHARVAPATATLRTEATRIAPAPARTPHATPTPDTRARWPRGWYAAGKYGL